MSDWYLISDNPHLGVRRWGKDDDNGTLIRTEYYAAVPFMEANATQYRESIGEKFGSGPTGNGMRHVSSVPLHIWARELAPLEKAGDMKAIKAWHNDIDHRAFRTFRGKV